MPSSGETSHSSTRSILQNVLQGSSIYTVALLAQRLSSFILLPVNTRFLTPADYGVMELLEQTAIVVSTLSGGGIGSAIGFFYVERNEPEDRHRLLSTTFLGVLLLGFLTALVGSAIAGPLSIALPGAGEQFRSYLLFVMASMPLIYAVETQFSWLRVENQATLFARSSFLRIGIIIAGTLALVALLRLGVWGVLLTNSMAMLAVVAFLSARIFRGITWHFDKPLFFRMWRYAVPLGLSSLAVFIVHFGDRFILPRYRPLADLGVYSLAYKLGMVLTLIHTSFFSYWNSQVFIIMKRKDADVVFQRIFTYFMLVFSMAALGLVVCAGPLIRILTAPVYHTAIPLVPIIVCAYYFRSIGDFFRILFLVQNRPSFDAVCNWIGAAVCLAAYFLLIPTAGIRGAAIATLITFGTISVLSVVWSYRLRPFQLEWVRLFKVLGIAAVLTAVYFAYPVLSLWGQILWGGILLLAYPALLWVVRFPTEGEREQLFALLRRVMVRSPLEG